MKMFGFVKVMWAVVDKCHDALRYPLAWLTGVGLFLADIFAGHRLLVDVVVLVTVMDAVWGIAVSVSRKEFTKSELARLTVAKLAVYGSALLIFLALDRLVENETGLEIAITSGLIGVLIVLTEGWSSLASMLILFPNNPMLKLAQKALTGEIARKLGCDESEVEKILNASRRKKKKTKRDKNGRFVSSKDADGAKDGSKRNGRKNGQKLANPAKKEEE